MNSSYRGRDVLTLHAARITPRSFRKHVRLFATCRKITAVTIASHDFVAASFSFDLSISKFERCYLIATCGVKKWFRSDMVDLEFSVPRQHREASGLCLDDGSRCFEYCPFIKFSAGRTCKAGYCLSSFDYA
jgi:hypothetical protein